ncbi:hypothetical protein BFP97_10590 [Roseivirga sp. 4D4]|uniref:helix-turn-helix domain-containing protein n=1 Tax=Roseivirga sp. 4D4 TaxID=1889784 RepID=UPI0008529E53|nr:helix-turn-helix transcriptional regulator [Roseivirga sp. 4D4]OEK01936.1 hypothetical protein BFP97_10590 [Roseivirga sp. 4D4]
MSKEGHIPLLKTISDFYQTLRIGTPQGDDFSIMRIEDQPDTKLVEMPLFRCNFYRLVFLTSPGVIWNLPDQQFSNSIDSIYFSHPGKLESWVIDRKISGYLVCFTDDFAGINALHSTFQEAYPYFHLDSQSILRMEESTAAAIKQTLEKMLMEMNSNQPDKKEMLRNLLQQYLIQVRRVYTDQFGTEAGQQSNPLSIYNKFKKEVATYFQLLADSKTHQQASVALIAARVNLNPSYLNTVIKNLTGKTASDYIHHQTLLEIKSYLMHTDLQMAEISHRLGFTNISYFNRFFKRLTQSTPLKFRRANRLLQ